MKASPAGIHSIAPLPGLVVLDQGRVIVLSCEAELAAQYTAHAPAAGQFSLSQPYQTLAAETKPTDALPHSSFDIRRPAAVTSGAAETPPHCHADDGIHGAEDADAAATPQASGAAHPVPQPASRRKRKRKAAKAQNEAEIEVQLGLYRSRRASSPLYCRGLTRARSATPCCVVCRLLDGMPHSSRPSRLRRPPCSSGSQRAAQLRRAARSQPLCKTMHANTQRADHRLLADASR